MSFLQVLILSFIEGLTEFLPVSSTGHLIVATAMMKLKDEQFMQCFNVIIQFGAILSVLVLYWKRFLPINIEFYKKLVVAVLPAIVLGLLLKKKIDILLSNVEIVGWALLAGGVILIWSDQFFADKIGKHQEHESSIAKLSWMQCLKIGFAQCFAMIPGVSRSGASIIGGMGVGLSRKEAAEFSFFLAVPTMAGATLLQTLKLYKTVQPGQWSSLFLGIFLSFVFAMVAIKFFITLVGKFGYKHFGIYRIIIGAIILLMAHKHLL